MKNFINQSWKFIIVILSLSLIAIWISIPENKNLCLTASILWLVSVIALIFPRRAQIYLGIKSNYFKNLSSNLVTLFLVIAIVSMINFLGYQRPLTIDITKQKINSLSDQTIKLLEQIPGDLKVELYAKREKWANSLSILELFRYHKNNLIIEPIDIDKNLIRAQSNNIAEENSIRLVYQNRSTVAALRSELSITNAIIRLLREKPYRIGFTINHGEIEHDKKGNDGINFFLGGLKADFYELGSQDLSKPGSIEKDLIIIAGPKIDFDDQQIERLTEYLQSGGKILALLDPNLEEDNLANLRIFFKSWGINIGRNIVVDRMSTLEGVDASILMSKKFSDIHEITKNFEKNVIFPVTSSVTVEKMEGFNYYPLVYSTEFPASWAESDLASVANGNVKFEETDLKGPVSVAIVADKKIYTNKKTRIAVFGSSRIILDGYQGQSINHNLIMNTVSWLVEEDKVLSLNRPAIVQEQIFMSKTQLNIIFYFSIIFTPLLLLGVAILFYKRRQRL